MQLTLKTLVLALPAIVAVSTAAAAIPQVQRDVQDDYQEDSPEAIQAMWDTVERRDDPPPPACNLGKRLVFSGAKHTDGRQIDQGCTMSGTQTTDTNIDLSKTDGSTHAQDSGNSWDKSGGNNQGSKGDVDLSNQGTIRNCRRSAGNYGLGRRHAFGRRSPNAATDAAKAEKLKEKAAKKATKLAGKQGDVVKGVGSSLTKSNSQNFQSTKDSSNHQDWSNHGDYSKHDNSDHSQNQSTNVYTGSGDITGNGIGAQCNNRRDNEEFEALEARMEDAGAQVLRAIGGMSRRHEDSPLEVLARRDMAMVAQALGVRADVFDDGSVYRRNSAPQLACDYKECGEVERREAEDFLRAHARDLGFSII